MIITKDEWDTIKNATIGMTPVFMIWGVFCYHAMGLLAPLILGLVAVVIFCVWPVALLSLKLWSRERREEIKESWK